MNLIQRIKFIRKVKKEVKRITRLVEDRDGFYQIGEMQIRKEDVKDEEK